MTAWKVALTLWKDKGARRCSSVRESSGQKSVVGGSIPPIGWVLEGHMPNSQDLPRDSRHCGYETSVIQLG